MKVKILAILAALAMMLGIGFVAAPAQAYTNQPGQSVENSCQSPGPLTIITNAGYKVNVPPCNKYQKATGASNAPASWYLGPGWCDVWVYNLDYVTHYDNGNPYGKYPSVGSGGDKFVKYYRC